MGNTRIEAASRVTDLVEAQLDKVRQELGLPRRLNGYGVYRARHEVRQSLEVMRGEVERAIAEFDAVSWPSLQEYEEQ